MRTESISNNSENKKIITEVQKVEKSANTKPFDYYYKIFLVY